MCRLFGLLGGPVTPPEPWLVSTDRSLLAQSDVTPETRQSDGWGISWFASTRVPRVEKGIGGAYQPGERDRFVAAAKLAKGPVVLGHLRHASNPMGLPKGRLIGLENSQPFVHGSIMFAHNGAISFPRETRPLLGKYESRLLGVNDSEVLFWLLVKHTEALGDPLSAYRRCVTDLVQVWEDLGRPEEGPYTGLNVLFSRGPNELWAFCHSRGEHGGGLFDTQVPYYQMTYSADAKHVVVGSEAFDSSGKGWRPIPNRTYLMAHAAEGLVGVKTGPIPAPATAKRGSRSR
jgi:Glutamine amidotransferases class-II